MDGMETTQKVLQWITLTLALIFIILGIGIISGVFFPGRIFMEGGIRYVMGIVLLAYGIFRIFTVLRKMSREKRENALAKKT